MIRALKEEEIEDAERIVRLAFGTFLEIPNPLANPLRVGHRAQVAQ